MFEWEIDDIAGSTWSPLAEVAWIEAETNTETCARKSGIPRDSSTEFVTKVINESAVHDQTVNDEYRKRGCKRTSSEKNGAFEEQSIWKSGYSAHNRMISLQKGNCLPLSSLDSSYSTLKGVDDKKGIFKYGFQRTDMCKGESSCNAEEAEIVKSSCHFLPSDACPPGGDLEFLTEALEEARRENLLEFGWGNTNCVEDMDKLFLSTDSILSHNFDNSTGMLWDPPSPTLRDSLETLSQPADMPASQELRTGEAAKDSEAKAESLGSRSSLKQETAPTAEGWRSSSHEKQLDESTHGSYLPMQVDSCTDCSNGNKWESQGLSAEGNKGSDSVESKSIHTAKDVDKCKASRSRRHGPRLKKNEDIVRKSTGSQQNVTLSLEHTNKSSLMYVPMVPIAQDSAPSSAQVSWVSSCESISPIQCLQPVPYVHAGFGFPARHHLPVVVPSPSLVPQQLQPQGQPVFIGYPSQFIDSSKLQSNKGCLDVLSQSPTGSSTMTPREKIEKLRWRQKMQARLAVEQQQQQLINQRLIPEQAEFGRGAPMANSEQGLSGSVQQRVHSPSAEPLKWNERPVSIEGHTMEDKDESLAAAVLYQLLNIATKMDVRTRRCLRDGFCRLARNALQRRAAEDDQGFKRNNSELLHRSCGADSSSSSEQSSSQRLLTVDDIVETETNPMDRFIAHLLFHKRFHSPCTVSDGNCTPCNNSETSEADILHQHGLTWNESNQCSYPSTATRSSSVTGEAVISKGPNTIPEVSISEFHSCERPELNLQQEFRKMNSVPSDKALQQLLEREICPIGIEMGISSTKCLDFSSEVAEPLP